MKKRFWPAGPIGEKQHQLFNNSFDLEPPRVLELIKRDFNPRGGLWGFKQSKYAVVAFSNLLIFILMTFSSPVKLVLNDSQLHCGKV